MRHQRLWPSFCAFLLAGAWWDVSWARAVNATSGLAKTQWRLVEFQSMDDAQGTQRPTAPSRYVLRLDADGTATLWLNCDRVTGTWEAQPAGNSAKRAPGQPLSGKFEFDHFPERTKPCPKPGLEETMLRHTGKVRSFMLKQGRLHLSLVADGGVYVWARDTITAAGTATAAAATDASASPTTPSTTPATAPATSTTATPAPAREPAASRPEVWQVTRRVNLREQPSTRSRVLALLAPGTRMQRGACQPAEGREWCRVTVQSGGEGFVAAEYLRQLPR